MMIDELWTGNEGTRLAVVARVPFTLSAHPLAAESTSHSSSFNAFLNRPWSNFITFSTVLCHEYPTKWQPPIVVSFRMRTKFLSSFSALPRWASSVSLPWLPSLSTTTRT